jgi:hypothetical protein
MPGRTNQAALTTAAEERQIDEHWLADSIGNLQIRDREV